MTIGVRARNDVSGRRRRRLRAALVTLGVALALTAPALPGPLQAAPASASDGPLVLGRWGGADDHGAVIDLGYTDLRWQPMRSPYVSVRPAPGIGVAIDSIRVTNYSWPSGMAAFELSGSRCSTGRELTSECFFYIGDNTGVNRSQRSAQVEFAYRSPASSTVVQTLRKEFRWTPALPPGEPGVTVTPGPRARQVSLTLTPPTDDGGAPVTFEVQGVFTEEPRYVAFTETRASSSNPTRLTISDLPAGSEIEVSTTARNAIGRATAPGVLVVVPGVPSSPEPASVRRPLGQPVTVSWSVPADDGGAPIQYYEVHRRSDRSFDEVLIGRTTQLTWQDNPGLPGTATWSYRVRAVTRYGEGEYSLLRSAPLVDLP